MGGKFSKRGQGAKPSQLTSGAINKLHKVEAEEVGKNLSLEDIANFASSSRKFNDFFQPILDIAKKVQELLTAAVQGNPEKLEEFVKANLLRPELTKNLLLLFKKGKVTDPNSTTFYEVSPSQLMTFLLDDDMKTKIIELIPDTITVVKENGEPLTIDLKDKRQTQDEELGKGGADLVKIGKDPMVSIAEGKFDEILQFKATYTIDNQPQEVIFPLLENPDGILYYQDEAGLAHFYYANRETKTVKEIDPPANSKQALEALFANMEVNSSRRSSNDEHQLIANTMQHQLHRKGILYERNGVRFRDSHADFNELLNAYRHCIRLYQEGNFADGHKQWREGVGGAQPNVIWLLQRLCEKDRPFYPLPDFKSPPFKRGFDIYNYDTGRESLVVANGVHGVLARGLGSDFAICSVGGGAAGAAWACGLGCVACGLRGAAPDLVAVCRLIESAKANVVESRAEQDLDDTDANQAPRPA